MRRVLPWLAPLAGLAILVVALRALNGELDQMSLRDITARFAALPPLSVLAAILCTAASYALLTSYDWLGLRYLGHKLPYRFVGPLSFTAFAVGNNVGVSSLSGGAIRYRAYSQAGLAVTDIATLVAFISLSFFLGAALLCGLALLLEPARALSPLNLSETVLRTLGVLLLAVPLGYLTLVATRRAPLQLWRWTLHLPSPRIAASQVTLASLDLLVTSLVLYVLVRAFVDLPYFVFLGAFLLALVAGVISTVPGALGVFESILVLLLPEVPAPTLLGVLLAYRLVYYLLPLLVAMLFIVAHELPRARERLRKVRAATRWSTRLLPQVMALVVFIAGASLVVRGALPSTFALAGRLLPVPVLELSHLLSSIIGSGLLIVAHGLYRRLRRALLLSQALLLLAIVVALASSDGLPQVLPLILLLGLTWLVRGEFRRGAPLLAQMPDIDWLMEVALVLAITVGLGLFVHRNVAYSNELWWQFSLSGDASRMLRAMLAVVLVLGGFLFARLLHGRPAHGARTTADPESIAALVRACPVSAANIALLGDKYFLMHPSGEAFVMYRPSGHSWVALGDPVGNPEYFEELLWSFREACDDNGARCVFYEVTTTQLSLYIELGLSFLKLGEEAVVDLHHFGIEGSRRAELRQALNKGRRLGAEFTVIPAVEVPAMLAELARVSDDWLHSKSVQEKGFSLGRFDSDYLRHFDCATVRVNGKLVAFANLWQGADRYELSIDLMRYSTEAPNGIMDFLFTEIMLWGKAQGFARFNLGMAPLSGLDPHALAPPWHKFGNLVYRFGEHFYNFEGLRQYKSKFDPQWEPKYLASAGGLQLPAVLIDVAAVISGGVKGIFFK
jgi:phosphatidylglycerol lysyltransferase